MERQNTTRDLVRASVALSVAALGVTVARLVGKKHIAGPAENHWTPLDELPPSNGFHVPLYEEVVNVEPVLPSEGNLTPPEAA